MVAQVRGHISIDMGPAYGGEVAVARTSADRHPLDDPDRADCWSSSLPGPEGADALGRPGAPLVDADDARACARECIDDLVDRLPRDERDELDPVRLRQCLQRLDVDETNGCREGVGDSVLRDVGVGVGDVQGDTRADQRRDGAALRFACGDRVHAAQQQRMVGQQQVSPPVERLVDDRLRRVYGKEHFADRLVRVASDKTDVVPRLGGAWVVEVVQDSDDIAQHQRHERART